MGTLGVKYLSPGIVARSTVITISRLSSVENIVDNSNSMQYFVKYFTSHQQRDSTFSGLLKDDCTNAFFASAKFILWRRL
jgi:hypothetical protein